MRLIILTSLASVFLASCAATDQEVGTVVGSTAAGAALGALGGAALDPWDRSRGATSGALAGAAIGGAIGYANVAQQRQQQYQQYSYPYYASPPPSAPIGYGGERCVTTQTTDRYGRVTTTERCTGNVPPPAYRYY